MDVKDGVIQKWISDIKEGTAYRLLKELHQKSIKENNGKVNIREIKGNHIGETVEKY